MESKRTYKIELVKQYGVMLLKGALTLKEQAQLLKKV
jgi:hypothetical protein